MSNFAQRLLVLVLGTALLGGCASGLSLRECQEFSGRGFDVTTLTISESGQIFAGGKTARLGSCLGVALGGESYKPAIYSSGDKGNTWKGVQLTTDQKFFDSKITSIVTKHDGTVFAAVALKHMSLLDWTGTNDGHIYYSFDSGATWNEISHPSKPAYISSIAAGRDSNVFAYVCGGGVFHSEDNGSTWTFSGLSYPPSDRKLFYCGGFKVFSTPDGNVYAYGAGANGEGFYRSTDNGVTWRRLPIRPRRSIEIASNARGHLIAASSGPWEATLYRSIDSGETWEEIRAPHQMWVEALAVGGGGEIYAMTMENLFAPGGGLFRSKDGGKTWEKLPRIPPKNSVYSLGDFMVNHEGTLYFGLKGTPNMAPPVVFGGEIYRSDDQGSTWQLLNVLPKQ